VCFTDEPPHGANHFDHWMIVLESLKALQGYDTIIIGHDTPVDVRDRQHDDLRQARQESMRLPPTRKATAEKLKAAFPDCTCRLCRFAASYL